MWSVMVITYLQLLLSQVFQVMLRYYVTVLEFILTGDQMERTFTSNKIANSQHLLEAQCIILICNSTKCVKKLYCGYTAPKQNPATQSTWVQPARSVHHECVMYTFNLVTPEECFGTAKRAPAVSSST